MPDGAPTGGASPEPDEDLFRRFAATRDRRLRNELVERHLGLADGAAGRYRGRGPGGEDLHQVAFLALVKAVDRFDPEREVAFSTFAGRTIDGELKRHFRDATWTVRVPRSVKDLHVAVRTASEELEQRLGRSPTVRALAEHREVAPADLVGALGAVAARRPASLDAPPDARPVDHVAELGEGGDEVDLEDRDEVEHLLGLLDERSREIVRLRFYAGLTQDEIAARVGISQMHVSRLLRRSFETMRAGADEAQGGSGGEQL